jgi:hypothetical protein
VSLQYHCFIGILSLVGTLLCHHKQQCASLVHASMSLPRHQPARQHACVNIFIFFGSITAAPFLQASVCFPSTLTASDHHRFCFHPISVLPLPVILTIIATPSSIHVRSTICPIKSLPVLLQILSLRPFRGPTVLYMQFDLLQYMRVNLVVLLNRLYNLPFS